MSAKKGVFRGWLIRRRKRNEGKKGHIQSELEELRDAAKDHNHRNRKVDDATRKKENKIILAKEKHFHPPQDVSNGCARACCHQELPFILSRQASPRKFGSSTTRGKSLQVIREIHRECIICSIEIILTAKFDAMLSSSDAKCRKKVGQRVIYLVH